MKITGIPFAETGYFSSIIRDYLAEDSKLQGFYTLPPKLAAFEQAMASKQASFQHRSLIAERLEAQYAAANIKEKQAASTFANIRALANDQVFTITTGHQLCLFTGPLYFIYKIISVINLAKQLKERYPQAEFVPVYWMATEDHDFAEINHFRLFGEKLSWETQEKGAVGRMSTTGLDAVFAAFSEKVGNFYGHGQQLQQWFEAAYVKQENLADASRHLVHALFGGEGLVIVDGDDRALKSVFAPVAQVELETQVVEGLVNAQSERLAQQYKIQVNPRNINLFYLDEQLRERIEVEGEGYGIVDTQLRFSKAEMQGILKESPERISPNVLLRPLYQEMILPNLAYIGGGGELAYWFQLKGVFDHFEVPMPMLLLRNSVAWANEKISKLIAQLELSPKALFEPYESLSGTYAKAKTDKSLELKEELAQMQAMYKELGSRAANIDQTLVPHVEAMQALHLKKLEGIEKKFLRAEKRNQETAMDRLWKVKEALFPNGGLQERSTNFSELYQEYGPEFFQVLKEHLALPTQDFLWVGE